jgi:zinc transporter 2
VAATQRLVRRKLMLATVFALAFMGVEIAGGIIAGSLAIVTDAAHLFTDIANFISAILASHLAEQGPSNKLSYGEWSIIIPQSPMHYCLLYTWHHVSP